MTDAEILATPFQRLKAMSQLPKDEQGRFHCPDCDHVETHPITMGMHRKRMHGYVSPAQRFLKLTGTDKPARRKKQRADTTTRSAATPPPPMSSPDEDIPINYCPNCAFHLRPLIVSARIAERLHNNA